MTTAAPESSFKSIALIGLIERLLVRSRFLILLSAALLQLAVADPTLRGSTELSGSLTQAVTAATNAFKAQFTLDLKHYTIYIDKHEKEFEVTFVPDEPHKVDARHPGIAGGESVYGPEVHYFVSRKTFKVIRYEYAR